MYSICANLRNLRIYLPNLSMGKPTGFIEFEREIPADRAPLERIKDWDEFHLHMPEEKLRTQGSR